MNRPIAAHQPTPLGTWEWDFRTGMVICSNELIQLLGQDLTDFPVAYQTFLNWIYPEDREHVHITLRQSRAQKQHFFLEHRCLSKEGRMRYLECWGEPLLDTQAEVIGLRSHYRNISSRYLTEQLLKETEANLRNLLENMPDAVLIINPLGGIVFLNQKTETLFGIKRKDLLGKQFEQLIPQESQAYYRELITLFRQDFTIKQVRSEKELLFLSGLKGNFPADLMLGSTNFKGPGNCIAIVRDISALKAVETEIRTLNQSLEQRVKERTETIEKAHLDLAEAHNFSLQVLDALPSHICVLNAAGDIIMINQGWKDLECLDLLQDYRYSKGTPYLELCLQTDLKDSLSHWIGQKIESLLKGQITHFQQEYPCQVKGQKFWFFLSAQRFELDGKPHAVIAHQNITSLKESEVLLQQMRHKAESANRAKSVFLANISHEIRTPLNAILGFSQILQKESLEEYNLHPYIDEISKSGNHLLRLINHILELSGSEGQALRLQESRFSLLTLLNNLLNPCLVQAEHRKINFLSHLPSVDCILLADRGKLEQIILQLLNNAFQYTQTGQIALEVKLDSNQGSGCLYLSVRDTGIGIAEEQLEQIFLPFAKTEIGLHLPGHTGLGLPVCKAYCHLMGGELFVQSQLGQGSTFSLSLPLTEIIWQNSESSQEDLTPLNIQELKKQIEIAILMGEDQELAQLVKKFKPAHLAQELLLLAQEFQYERLLSKLLEL
jgi:PAS domain S-box-containing protein